MMPKFKNNFFFQASALSLLFLILIVLVQFVDHSKNTAQALRPPNAQISTSSSSTCTVIENNNIYCWGNNAAGQLGDGTTTTRYYPVRVVKGQADPADTDGTYLTNIEAEQNIKSVSSSSLGFVCAASNAGNLYCWGQNTSGFLGNNTTSASDYPIRVVNNTDTDPADTDGTYLINIKSVSAVLSHVCATSNSGNVYCWGNGSFGVLGNNSTADSYIPVHVLKGPDTDPADTDGTYLTNIKVAYAGIDNTCALSFAGNVYCWGQNNNGVIGDGTMTESDVPVRVLKGAAQPSDIDGTDTYLTNIIDLELNGVSSESACVVSGEENVYCWGSGGFLGDGTSNQSSVPVQVIDGEASTVSGDSASGFIKGDSINGSCVIAPSSGVYCWGSDSYGRLGNDNTIDSNSPVRVVNGEAAGSDNSSGYLTNISQLSLGSNAFFQCAVSNSKHFYCWGRNTFEVLGNGLTANSSVPALVIRDCGLRQTITSSNISFACEFNSDGSLTSALRLMSDSIRGIILVPTADSKASPVRIDTSSGVQSLRQWGI